MKKAIGIVVAAVAVAMLAIGVGCSASSSSKYNVYELDYKSSGYVEYDIVFSKYDSAYKDDVLSGFIDETHYYKTSYTLSDVEDICDEVYPGIDGLSFVTQTITDEGDYYCCIVEFKDLDKSDNLKTLYDKKLLFSISSNSDRLVDASFFQSSIKHQGGVEVSESDVPGLGLHANLGK